MDRGRSVWFGVINQSEPKRRWVGMLLLAIAFAMMIWGQIVLNVHLSGTGFALYWGACFALSLAAVVMGILDVRGVLRTLKAERAARLRQTFRRIKRPDKLADGSQVNQ